MSGYGNAQKNPPWARTAGQSLPQASAQSIMANAGLLQYPQVFQGQQAAIGMAGLPPAAVAPMRAAMQAAQPQYDMNPFQAAVSYPTRALNSAAFQQGQGPPLPPPVQAAASQQSNNKQRVFTGTVTKVQDNFGFVDEDIFFQSSCCVKGSSPRVGDRVLVEALYNANMPFKWNATRIQVLNNNQHDQGGGDQRGGGGMGNQHQQYNRGSNYSAVPPPSSHGGSGSGGSRFSGGGGGGGGGGGSRFNQRGNSPGNRGGNRGGGDRGSGANIRRDDDRDRDRKRKRDDRDRDEKTKSPPRKRPASPPAKTARRTQRRLPPRYSVTVPKTSLNGHDGDVVEIKKRYPNMYIPSDFFLSEYKWTETFPIGSPMSLDFPCAFHVMHRDVDPLTEITAVHEPPDADYIYSAKVMLLASPGLEDLFSKCITLAEDRASSRSTTDEETLSHPSKLITFLVGTRGTEYMAIGGPWSPSEDGENPATDPSVLVRTAIRTTKALTGIDLSNCTQWFRFLEAHYHRGETCYRGKNYPARVETVVMFVPDVWSLVPPRLEWDEIQLLYQNALEKRLNGEDQPDQQKEDGDETIEEKEEPDSQNDSENTKRDPKHYSELDPKNLKVNELRDELEARSLSSKGLKSQLVARLSKVLKTEEEEDNKQKEKDKEKKDTPEQKEPKVEKKKEDEEKKKIDEKERQVWEKRYKLPKKPHIVVHPNKTAKSGKFNCSVQTLSNLLAYRQEDTKEHSFEVSIFAELFNEMLMRDFGFNIFRAIAEAPEKPKEEKKDDKEKTKDEKEKSKDDKEKGKDDEKENKKDKDKDSKSKDKDKENDKKVDDEEMDAQSSDENDEDKDMKDDASSKDDSKKGDKENRKERVRLVTFDKMLLLSFTFFDQTRCNYIYDKDVEDLLFSLGLTLSRSQIRRLVGKVVQRDTVYYRRLTDKPENTPPAEHLPVEQLVGNKLLLPSCLANDQGDTSSNKSEVKEGQMITYKGTLIDIGKLMDQLTRSEITRNETEKSLGKLRDELSRLKESAVRSEKHIKDLTSDLKDYRERLSSTNSDLSSLQIKERQFLRTLNEISDKIRPLIAKPEPKSEPKSEPPSSNSNKHSDVKVEKNIKVENESVSKKESEIKKESKESDKKESKEPDKKDNETKKAEEPMAVDEEKK